ncbi:MAG: leucine-rich repeat protein [Oscillospiraceae bacterium]|nr:leucine-rich repeat protein [Oscillospiraceae bacterium]
MYERQNFVKGQKLRADQLNHMEDGILSAVSVNNQDLTPQQQAQARGNIGAVSNEQLEEVKTSVSEGKALVAAAVTGKGVETAANATFATIAANIESIEASGGDIDGLIEGSITEIFSQAAKVTQYTFYSRPELVSANFPLATSCGAYAFYACTQLTSIYLPKATSIGPYSFRGCWKLPRISFPKAETVPSNSIYGCTELEIADFANAASVAAQAFYNCYKLKALVLRYDGVVSLANTNAFANCHWLEGTANATYNPNGERGYVYVPRVRILQYPLSTNWAALGFQYRALEDYTVDGTITGELDEAKMNATGGGSGGGSGDIM